MNQDPVTCCCQPFARVITGSCILTLLDASPCNQTSVTCGSGDHQAGTLKVAPALGHGPQLCLSGAYLGSVGTLRSTKDFISFFEFGLPASWQ